MTRAIIIIIIIIIIILIIRENRCIIHNCKCMSSKQGVAQKHGCRIVLAPHNMHLSLNEALPAS